MIRNLSYTRLKAHTKSFFSSYGQVFLLFPVLLLYLFASELCLIAENSLVLRKICVYEFNQTLCDDSVFKNKTFENQVQKEANKWMLWSELTFYIPAIISILQLVTVADRKLNYRTPMIVSLVGYICFAIVSLIASTQSTYVCLWLILLSQFLNGILGGGLLSFISSCFSHITVVEEKNSVISLRLLNEDITKSKEQKNRSIKYSIMESSILFGRFAGSSLSGVILGDKSNFKNYQNAYAIALALFCFIFFYIFLMFYFIDKRKNYLNVSIISITNSEILEADRPEDDSQEQKLRLFTKCAGLKTFFRTKILFFIDIWQTLTKRRDNNVRFYLLAFLCIYFLISCVRFGAQSIEYLFLTKMPISLKQTKYGLLRGLNTLFSGISLLIILPILKSVFNFGDHVLYMLGITSDILKFVVFCIASVYTSIIWLVPVVFMFSSYYVVCLRSFISKLIDKNEIGKFFGIVSVLEFVSMAIGSSVYNRVYNATIDNYPFLVFAISAVIGLVLFYPLLLTFSIKYRKSQNNVSTIRSFANDSMFENSEMNN